MSEVTEGTQTIEVLAPGESVADGGVQNASPPASGEPGDSYLIHRLKAGNTDSETTYDDFSLPQDSSFLDSRDTGDLFEEASSSIEKRLERYGKARTRTENMTQFLFCQADTSNIYLKLADKMRLCTSHLEFRSYYTRGEIRLHNAMFCKLHMLCPMCAIRRGAKVLKKYAEKIGTCLTEDRNLKAYLVTVTIKNGPCLSDRYDAIRGAWQKVIDLRRHNRNRKHKREGTELDKSVGGIWSLEVKRGRGSGLWHPHIHAVVLFEETPSEHALVDQWRKLTGDSYIVDVRPMNCNRVLDLDLQDNDALLRTIAKDAAEVCKYALKFSTMSHEDNLYAFETLRRNNRQVRLADSFGCLRGVKVSTDLLDEPMNENDLPFVSLFFSYDERVEGYVERDWAYDHRNGDTGESYWDEPFEKQYQQESEVPF